MKGSYFYTRRSAGHGKGAGVRVGTVVLSQFYAFLILSLPCAHPCDLQPTGLRRAACHRESVANLESLKWGVLWAVLVQPQHSLQMPSPEASKPSVR